MKIIGVAKAPPLPELVYQELKKAVLNGQYAPGEMLRQEEVATALGVSRAPLREALPRLESEGIVVLHPRRGYAVVEMTPAEIESVFSLRILLETDMVRRSAAKRKMRDVELALQAADQMSKIDVNSGPEAQNEWFETNLRFHDLLLSPAHCTHHMRALRLTRGALEAYIRTEARLTGDLDQAQAEHNALALAFAAGDAERLVQLTRRHSEHTRDRLLLGMKAKEPATPHQ